MIRFIAKKDIWLHVTTFLFLFVPFVQVMGIRIHLPYLLLMVILSIWLLNTLVTRRVDRDLIRLALLLIINVALLVGSGSFYGVLDKEFITIFIIGLMNLFACFVIAKTYLYASDSTLLLYKSIFIACSLHALIMFLQFFSSTFSDLLYSFVILGEVGKKFVEVGSRSPGLTGSGGDHLSVIQAVGFCCGYALYIRERMTHTTKLVCLISLGLIIISIMLSARSGLVFVVIGILYFTWKLIFSTRNWGVRYRISSLGFYRVSFLIVALLTSLIVMYLFLKDSSYTRLYKRSFELVINILQSGEFRTNSTDALSNMYFIPDTSMSLLFGTGDFGRNEVHLPSDIGFVRMLFGGGVVGILMFLLPIIYVVLKSVKVQSIVRDDCSMMLLYLIVFLVTTIVIFNMKVVHLYGNRETYKVLFISFFLLMGYKGKVIKNEK